MLILQNVNGRQQNVNMEKWWNNKWQGKLEYLENDLSQGQFVHHKSHKEVHYNKYHKHPVLIWTFTVFNTLHSKYTLS